MNGCICVPENAFDSYFYQPGVGCVHIQSYKCEIGYYQPSKSTSFTSSSSSYGSFSSRLSSAFSSASSRSSSRTILDCQECTTQSTDK